MRDIAEGVKMNNELIEMVRNMVRRETETHNREYGR